MKFKAANTPIFTALAEEADKSQRNRRVTETLLKRLDPDGIHLVVFSMLHNDNEIRTQWFVKLEEQEEPAQVWLDVSISNFNMLKEMST